MFINKNNKFLIIILLSILFTLTKNTNVLADSQLQININGGNLSKVLKWDDFYLGAYNYEKKYK